MPGAHTRQLYDSLTRPEAQLIAQLRTGKCRLNSYLYRINAVESNLCELCRVPETVRHFLVECARWTAERAEHLQVATKRWCDVSYILGGWFSGRLDGPRHRWRGEHAGDQSDHQIYTGDRPSAGVMKAAGTKHVLQGVHCSYFLLLRRYTTNLYIL